MLNGISSAFNWVKQSRLVVGTGKLCNAVTTSRPVTVASKIYGGYCLYHLWESATSHLFVVDTCRHGTGPLSYLNISVRGADPTRGGQGGEIVYREKTSSWGPTEANRANCNGTFHIYRDARYLNSEEAFWVKFHPRRYAGMGGVAELSLPRSAPAGIQSASLIWGHLIGWLTPTLKFHFEPESKASCDYQGFRYDTSYPYGGPIALQTDQSISPLRLGMTGSLYSGLNVRLPKRIFRNPSRFALGAIQATLAAFVTAKMLGKPLQLPVPKLCKRLWEYRAIRWPIEYGIRFSAW